MTTPASERADRLAALLRASPGARVLTVGPGRDVEPADEPELLRSLAACGAGELDLVVDDTGAEYRSARAAFEVLFPRLVPGGRYVLAEWAWAHADPDLDPRPLGPWVERPALTNLVVELVLLAGTAPDLLRDLRVTADLVVAERGDRPVTGPLRLAATYRNRGLRYRPVL